MYHDICILYKPILRFQVILRENLQKIESTIKDTDRITMDKIILKPYVLKTCLCC